MFRVWDTIENKWVSSDIVKFANDDIAEIKKGIWNQNRINLLSDNRYIYHNDIGCTDSNGDTIYEGDILEGFDTIVLVYYSNESASYIALDYSNSVYLPLGTSICSELKIVGNVCENKELLGINDEEES